ncbi:hypothetical protein FPQ18DRAFT_305470 [Pyronema domesticum]|nr:hypothetical protein FPQ18DRAFT_305470 [Pyronema domesticum]
MPLIHAAAQVGVAMDPLSISAGVAGFLSLAIEISKISTNYVGSVKSEPEEAQKLLQEVSALCNVSEQLAQFLRNDEVKSKFESTSALVVTIDACHRKINDLFKKLKGLQVPSDNKVAGFIERLKWPLRKEDC